MDGMTCEWMDSGFVPQTQASFSSSKNSAAAFNTFFQCLSINTQSHKPSTLGSQWHISWIICGLAFCVNYQERSSGLISPQRPLMSCQVSKCPYANEQGRKRKSNLGFILIKSDLLSHCTPNEWNCSGRHRGKENWLGIVVDCWNCVKFLNHTARPLSSTA